MFTNKLTKTPIDLFPYYQCQGYSSNSKNIFVRMYWQISENNISPASEQKNIFSIEVPFPGKVFFSFSKNHSWLTFLKERSQVFSSNINKDKGDLATNCVISIPDSRHQLVKFRTYKYKYIYTVLFSTNLFLSNVK